MALQVGSWVQTIGQGWLVKVDLGGSATDLATVECFEQAAPPDQLYMGLERYWRKKAE